jgi:hypothetical protein
VHGIPWAIASGPDQALCFTNQFTNGQSGSIERALACGSGMSLSYDAGTLTMNFDVSVMTDAT